MIKSVSVLTDHLGPSQLSHEIINGLNDFVQLKTRADAVCFYEELRPLYGLALFGVMNITEAYNQHGLRIATSLKTVERLLSYIGSGPMALYVNDLEWLRKEYSFEYLNRIYTDKRLTLFARGSEYADIVQNVWAKPCLSLDKFNIPDILNTVNRTK